MKKSRNIFFYSILVSILFLSIGNISFANTYLAPKISSAVPGEIQQDHHLKYDVQCSAFELHLAESNYKLPHFNELDSDLQVSHLSNISSKIHVLNEKVLMSVRDMVLVCPSLDGLTMIYPFHTFL